MEGLLDDTNQEQGDSPDDGSEEGEEKSETSSSSNNQRGNIPNAEDFDPDGKNAMDEWEEFETESTWEDRKEELATAPGRGEYQYFGLPKANLGRMVVPYKEIIAEFDKEMPRNWGDTHERRDELHPHNEGCIHDNRAY